MLQMTETLLVLTINDAGKPGSPTACGQKLGQPLTVDVDPVSYAQSPQSEKQSNKS
jgi:hypothetical protein